MQSRFLVRQHPEAPSLEFPQQGFLDREIVRQAEFRRSGMDQRGKRSDGPGKLGLGIGLERETRLGRGGLLRFLPPGGEPARGRTIEKQGAAEQAFHGSLDLGSKLGHGPAQAQRFAALFLQHFEIVADRLFSRNGRKRAEDGGEETDGLILFGSAASPAETVRTGIDIDEPPVDFAAGGPPPQSGYGPLERLVHQHGTVDQGNAVHRILRNVHRHHPVHERRAVPPAASTFGERIDLADCQDGEGARKTRCRPRGQDEFERIGKVRSARIRRRRAKADGKSVFALHDGGRAVESQQRVVAVEIGRRHEQVDGVARGQQGLGRAARFHRHERPVEEIGETRTAERRFEPAAAHEHRDLASHFRPRFGRDRLADGVAGPA